MLEPNFSPFPLLVTERLVLREVVLQDAPEILIQRSDATINKFIKRELAVTIGDAEEWIRKVTLLQKKNESINWGITLKGSERLIGNICLWNIVKESDLAEVGYSLHYDYFGKGLMTEALVAVINYGFNVLKLKRMDAYTNKHNQRSINMLLKNGFERNYAFEEQYDDKEELEYNTIYSLARKAGI